MNLLTFVVLLSCLPSALIDFALPRWKADKSVRIEDAYKWTYQATRGGEHAVPDTESARSWLANEWSTLGANSMTEPIWEPLCPGGEIGRFNLRPFKAKGGQADDVLDAFLTSSRDYRSEGKNFIDAWNELGKRLKKKAFGNLDLKSWTALDTEMKSKNYPAIHHSSTYENANHPAYRILTVAESKKLILAAIHE